MPPDPRQTFYKTLMLAEIADEEIISTVYRKLAQRYHPDVDPSSEAARRMAEINEAYATLKDKDKRRKYDDWLASRRDRRRGDRLIVHQGDIAYGSAGAPAGPPQGSVVDFGRYAGWTLGQIKHRDPEFLEWLVRVPIGHRFRDEISQMLPTPLARTADRQGRR
jgi:curved DNA-binding protein CbpA